MKKSITFVAAIAVLSIPLFAENKVGKITGIQLKDNEAVINVAEGLINPFAEDSFVKSGDFSISVPLDIAVEFSFPKLARMPKRLPPMEAESDKDANDETDKENGLDRAPAMPKLEVKQLKIDQLLQVVYEEDGKTVSKIQVLPGMIGPRHKMAACHPGKAGDGNPFWKDEDDSEDKSSRKRNMFMPNNRSNYR